jgi:hypothetical protein
MDRRVENRRRRFELLHSDSVLHTRNRVVVGELAGGPADEQIASLAILGSCCQTKRIARDIRIEHEQIGSGFRAFVFIGK